KFATRMSADLIVMGTNGRRGPAKLFFGSVTQAVLRRTSTPVLVVARSRPKQSALKRQVHPVLAAVELGPDDRTDAKRMARAAAFIGGPLTLLHVVRRVPDLLGTPALLDPYHHRQVNEARKRLKEIADRVGAASRVVLGIPEDEITSTASDMKAGLIVLALRKGRGLFAARQGTTTYRILSASATPVLALPRIANRSRVVCCSLGRPCFERATAISLTHASGASVLFRARRALKESVVRETPPIVHDAPRFKQRRSRQASGRIRPERSG